MPDLTAQQVTLYGEPLAARFGRLLAAYGIPQSRLAATIGLSAPMLSQLASGQRVKISNPAVYGRLLRLEELAGSPAVRSGDPVRISTALDEVAASSPQLSTGVSVAGTDTADRLTTIADWHELEAAAAAVPGTKLSVLLLDAAYRARLRQRR